LKLQVL